MHKKRLVIVSKPRFITFLIIVFLFLMILINIALNNDKVYSSTYRNQYKKIIVDRGDTLWTIAKNNKKNGEDIREIIHNIKEINDMDSVLIKPGDIIRVPILK